MISEYVNEDGIEILDAGLGVVGAVADGISWSDLGALAAIPKAIGGFSEGVKSLGLAMRDDAGRGEVTKYVEDKLDIPNKVAEKRAEIVVNWATYTYDAAKDFSDASNLAPDGGPQ